MNLMHVSNFPRLEQDGYATPEELVTGLRAGLARMRMKLPQRVLDPLGGSGAIADALGRRGFSVSLSDLYPEQHPAYMLGGVSVDATNPKELARLVKFSKANAIVTNTPYKDSDLYAKALLDGLGKNGMEMLCLLYPIHWDGAQKRVPYFQQGRYVGKIVCTWRPAWFGSGGGKIASAWHVWTSRPRFGNPMPMIVHVKRGEQP